MTARELGSYVQAAWATYEDMREQRDEARCRVDELTDERDGLRGIAAALEEDSAAWERVARAWDALAAVPYCLERDADNVACSLPIHHDGACIFIGLLP